MANKILFRFWVKHGLTSIRVSGNIGQIIGQFLEHFSQILIISTLHLVFCRFVLLSKVFFAIAKQADLNIASPVLCTSSIRGGGRKSKNMP